MKIHYWIYLHILVVTNSTPSSHSFWFLSFSAKTFAIAMPKSSATFINLLTVDVSNWLSKSFHMISRRSSSKLLKIRVKLLQKKVENKLKHDSRILKINKIKNIQITKSALLVYRIFFPRGSLWFFPRLNLFHHKDKILLWQNGRRTNLVPSWQWNKSLWRPWILKMCELNVDCRLSNRIFFFCHFWNILAMACWPAASKLSESVQFTLFTCAAE